MSLYQQRERSKKAATRSSNRTAEIGRGCCKEIRQKCNPRWGRIVVLASFMTFVLQVGTAFTHGIYMPSFLTEFQVGSGETGWLTSLAAAVLCLGGPFGSVVVKRLGCRRAVMLGGTLMAIGNGLASLATELFHLVLCLGLVVGVGGSLISIGLVVIVGQYYNRHHAIANGLVFSGIGAGMFIFSPLVQFLIDTYGWRGSFILQAAIISNVIVTGALLRPASRYKRHNSSPDANCNTVGTLRRDVEDFNQEDDSDAQDCRGSLDDVDPKTKRRGDRDEKIRPCCWWISCAFRLGLCKLLKSTPSVVLVFLACFLLDAGVSAVLSHITNLAVLSGLTPQQASGLLSYLGIGSMIGRLTHGWLFKCRYVTPYNMFIAALLVSAPSATLIAMPIPFGGKIACVVIFGVASGSLYPLVAVIQRKMVGISQLSLAFGISMFCYGAGAQLGGFLIGAVKDATGEYILPFCLIGIFFALGAVVMLSRPVMRCYRRRTSQQTLAHLKD